MEVGPVEKLVFNHVSRAILAGIVLSPRGVLATRVAQKGKLLLCLRLFQLADSAPDTFRVTALERLWRVLERCDTISLVLLTASSSVTLLFFLHVKLLGLMAAS